MKNNEINTKENIEKKEVLENSDDVQEIEQDTEQNTDAESTDDNEIEESTDDNEAVESTDDNEAVESTDDNEAEEHKDAFGNPESSDSNDGPLGSLKKQDIEHYGGPLAKSVPLPEKEEVFEIEEKKDKDEKEDKKSGVNDTEDAEPTTHIFALRTTANREDQVMDFLSSNIKKRKLNVYSVIRPHGMRGYIFLEAEKRSDAEQAGFNIPYARGVLKNEIAYNEIEHMLEQVKKDVNIKKNDIAEIIAGPFKREKCKIMRIDKTKEEVVVELLDAAVPIPITLKVDSLKVIRRESDEEGESED